MKKSVAILLNELPSAAVKSAVAHEDEEAHHALEKLLADRRLYTSWLPRDVLNHLFHFCPPPLVTGEHHVVVSKGDSMKQFVEEAAKKLHMTAPVNQICVFDSSGHVITDPFSICDGTTVYLAPSSSQPFFQTQNANALLRGSARVVKVAILGAAACGKSALVSSFVSNNFIQHYDPTVEDSFRKMMDVDGNTVFFDILDTAGQEEYLSMRGSYLRARETALVFAFSLTNRQSFDTIEVELWTEFQRTENESSCVAVIVGCQADKEAERVVTRQEAEQLASRLGCRYIETSSRERENVEEVFFECARALDRRRPVRPTSRHGQRRCKKTCSLLSGPDMIEQPGGFVGHPLDHPTKLTQRFGMDLTSTARRYFDFVVQLDENKTFASLSLLERAVQRYHNFMRLKVKHSAQKLSPALDMQVVWWAHLIRPVMYSKYCEALGAMIDHHIVADSHLGPHVESTRELYEAEYHEPYAFDPSQSSTSLALPTSLSANLVSAEEVLRDRQWLHLPGGLLSIHRSADTQLYARLAKHYEQFLYLHAKYPNWDLPASATVDLLWHSHMLHPIVYRSDMEQIVGYYFVHTPWPDSGAEEEDNSFKQLDEMWQQEYCSPAPLLCVP